MGGSSERGETRVGGLFTCSYEICTNAYRLTTAHDELAAGKRRSKANILILYADTVVGFRRVGEHGARARRFGCTSCGTA